MSKEIRNSIFNLSEGSSSGSSSWTQPYFKDGDTFDNGKVIFQFDDGWESVYTYGLPLFQQKGIKTTTFINADGVGSTDATHGKKLTWAEIQEMIALGMDMQCHGNTGLFLAGATTQQVTDEYVNNNSAFVAQGLSIPLQTAYSNGSFDDHALNILDDYRKTGRTTINGYVTRKGSKYKMRGPMVQDLTDLNAIKAQMVISQNNKKALVIWGHQIGVPGDSLSLSVAKLEELIDYAVSLGMDIITTAQLYDLMFYIDIRTSRDCADDAIEIICKNKLSLSDSISIERSDDDGADYSEIHVLAPGDTNYLDEGLTLNKNYYYRARGFKGTKYLPYSLVTYCLTGGANFVLTSTGTGAGVSRLIISSFESLTLTLDGTARFYSDSAGTLNAATTQFVPSSIQTTVYIKCPSGTANLRMSHNLINIWKDWISGTNAASISGDISILKDMSYLTINGNNTLSGDITTLTALTLITVLGSNTLSGSVAGLTSLTYIYVTGSNTLSGSVAGLTSMTSLYVTGSNTLTGSIAALTLLNAITITGSNTLSGSIAALILLTHLEVDISNALSGSIAGLTLLQYCSVSGSTITYENVTNIKGLCYFKLPTTIVFTSANVNQLLADFWLNRDEAKIPANRSILLSGKIGTGAPSGQGATDKAALAAYRSPNPPGTAALWTVTTR